MPKQLYYRGQPVELVYTDPTKTYAIVMLPSGEEVWVKYCDLVEA